MTNEDKENIKNAILESIVKLNLDPLDLAKRACSAIDYINSYDDAKTSGEAR